MNRTLHLHRGLQCLVLLATCLAARIATAQTTAFTYQGHLMDNGASANGSYDIQFTLKNALAAGATIGTPQVVAPVNAVNGIFAVTLDFGSAPFDGSNRWVEIGVRPFGSAAAYTVLAPRQQLTSAPHAVRALNAGSAVTAATATNATNATNLTGTITAGNITAGTITGAMLANGTVGSTQLAAGSVTTTQIAAGSVAFADLAKPPQSGTVTSAEIDYDFNSARFRVAFPLAAAAVPIVTVALAPSALGFPDSAGARVMVSSTTGFTGKVTGVPVDDVIVDPASEAGTTGSFVTANGNPAIAYLDSSSPPSELRFARTSSVDGTGTWLRTVVDSSATDSVGSNPSTATVSGTPAIAYTTSAGSLKFARNSNSSGSGTWAVQTVVASGVNDCSLAVVNNSPAIAYHDSVSGNLRYARNSNADGSGTWSFVTVDTGGTADVGMNCTLVLVKDQPAISYADTTTVDLKFVRASNTTGTLWGTPVIVDSAGNVGDDAVMAIINGLPAIAYRDTTGDPAIKFAINGASEGNGAWVSSTINNAPGLIPLYGTGLDLKLVHDTPAITFFTGSDIRYLRALDGFGSTWDAPYDIASMTGGGIGGFSFTSLNIVGGSPAVFYFNNSTGERNLRFARSSQPVGGQVNWIALPP